MPEATICPKPVQPHDSHAAAARRMDEAKRRYTAAAWAVLSRDPDASALVEKALAELAAARQELADHGTSIQEETLAQGGR